MTPPRRSGPSLRGITARKLAAATAETTSSRTSSVELKSPGTGELLTAISNVDFGTAMYAGKAFVIATGIVTVGGVALAVGVKEVMGVHDVRVVSYFRQVQSDAGLLKQTREFAHRMRMLIWRGLPSLTSQIHRPLEAEDEGDLVPSSVQPDPTWNWEEAEKRMQAAYAKGGFGDWVQVAMREVEDELKVERARRQREDDSAHGKGLAT
ncbi:hypothetical protein DXG03_003332 [Asterophora parasitica]|uniref:Uncharacterized protein n=1 Tax=Asterophora parasitica TaxID=117018 RepID=A0A9P7FX91_9AGAR|nr:hypothetical protein DXG03_003332 [Asterophora parasitica]